MKKSHTFVPDASQLEDRIALSTVHFNGFGLPVLTQRAIQNVSNAVHNAFVRFGSDGLNYNRLNSDLIRAVNAVPYNIRDGLTATMTAEVSAARTSIAAGTIHPLLQSQSFVASDIRSFIVSEVTAGVFVVR